MARTNRKVSSYIINPKFQIKMIFICIWPLIGISIANYVAVMTFFSELRSQGESAGYSADHVFFQFLNKQQQSLSLYLGISFAVAILVFFVLGFYFSHKVAGPLYRMRKSLQDMAANNTLVPITFRQGDYFQDVKDSFNQLVEKLKSN